MYSELTQQLDINELKSLKDSLELLLQLTPNGFLKLISHLSVMIIVRIHSVLKVHLIYIASLVNGLIAFPTGRLWMTHHFKKLTLCMNNYI